MITPTTNIESIERERLLKLAEEYRNKGYEILLHPSSEDLPDFLKNYNPDMIVRRQDETVVVEVKSRSSLNSSSAQYLKNLAQAMEQRPGWRFELVMTNPDDTTYSIKAESSLQENEIKSGLQTARQLLERHPESAILYSWSLTEATLRLIAEKESLSLRRFDPLYLIKQLATEGIISQSGYQLLMNWLSLRNAIAHGFKTTPITQDSIYELIEMTEYLLKALHNHEEVN
ncbi:MAG: HEPN domain-containing protein [Waterburya sp.]